MDWFYCIGEQTCCIYHSSRNLIMISPPPQQERVEELLYNLTMMKRGGHFVPHNAQRFDVSSAKDIYAFYISKRKTE